jgi:hypothetical protein
VLLAVRERGVVELVRVVHHDAGQVDAVLRGDFAGRVDGGRDRGPRWRIEIGVEDRRGMRDGDPRVQEPPHLGDEGGVEGGAVRDDDDHGHAWLPGRIVPGHVGDLDRVLGDAVDRDAAVACVHVQGVRALCGWRELGAVREV